MDVEKWTEIAWKYAKSSNKKGLSGVEIDDLFQCAMIGMFLADKSYDESKGSFKTYAHWYIIKEIHNMIYKRSSEPKAQEAEITEEQEEWYDEDEEETAWVVNFLHTINLPNERKEFLYNMMAFGETFAVKEFMQTTGLSRSRTYQIRDRVKETAEKHYRRMEG